MSLETNKVILAESESRMAVRRDGLGSRGSKGTNFHQKNMLVKVLIPGSINSKETRLISGHFQRFQVRVTWFRCLGHVVS